MKLYEDLIKINTYTGKYNEIITCISDYLTHNTDCEIKIQQIDENKANLIAIFGDPELVINCHMDTVPPSDKWTYNPLSLTKTDKYYYGLGVADTKGNIYTAIKAVEKVKPKNLMLLFSIDEEAGVKTGVKYFLESEFKKGIKRAVVGEPTSLKMVSKHKGYYSFSIEETSKPQHSSIKSKGAIVRAAESIVKLDKAGFNIGIIDGGTAGNVVSQKCNFRASIRTFDNQKNVSQNVESICTGANVKSRFDGASLINEKPMFKGEFHEVDFWTEAALFQQEGINSIVLGAGDIKQAHTVDEFVEIEQIVNGQKILEKIIKGRE